MAVSANGRAQFRMIDYRVCCKTPKRVHHDENDSNYDDFVSRTDGKGRRVDPNVVATVGQRHHRYCCDSSLSVGTAVMSRSLFRPAALLVQFEEFFSADQDRDHSQQADVRARDHEREQRRRNTSAEQSGDPYILTEHSVSRAEPLIGEKAYEHEHIIDIG